MKSLLIFFVISIFVGCSSIGRPKEISRKTASYNSVLKRAACYNVYAYEPGEAWDFVCTKFNDNGEVIYASFDDAGPGHRPKCFISKPFSGEVKGSLSIDTGYGIHSFLPNTYKEGNEGTFTTRNGNFSYIRLGNKEEKRYLEDLESMECIKVKRGLFAF